MNISELRTIIREEISRIVTEKGSGNLHGDDRTQRQYLIDLANKNPDKIISLTIIADALGKTKDEVRDTYARQIRYYNNKDNDFVKIVDEVPYHSCAIYRLVGEEPLTSRQLSQIKFEEAKRFDKYNGVFYPILYKYKSNKTNKMMSYSDAYLNVMGVNENLKHIFDKYPPEIRQNLSLGARQYVEPTDGSEIVTLETLDNYVNGLIDGIFESVKKSKKVKL